LPQRKEVKQRNKPPGNQHTKNPTPRQDCWWTTELILESEDITHTNLNCHTTLRKELTK
jgi:hypothetical protein